MTRRPRRTITPERMAAIHLDARAKSCHWNDPQGAKRAALIAELQDIAAPWPHLLAEQAGLALGHARNLSETLAGEHLIAAQLLIEAGADLGEVERWAAEGEKRTHVGPWESHGYKEAHQHERDRREHLDQ